MESLVVRWHWWDQAESVRKCTDLHGLLYRSQQGHFLFISPPVCRVFRVRGSVNEELSKGRYTLTVLFRRHLKNVGVHQHKLLNSGPVVKPGLSYSLQHATLMAYDLCYLYDWISTSTPNNGQTHHLQQKITADLWPLWWGYNNNRTMLEWGSNSASSVYVMMLNSNKQANFMEVLLSLKPGTKCFIKAEHTVGNRNTA